MFEDRGESLDICVLKVKTIEAPGLRYICLMNDYEKKIPEIIRNLVLDSAHGNQNEAARKTGRPQRTIGRWMNGEAYPSLVEFCVFCEQLGKKPWDVLAADEKEKREIAVTRLKQAAEEVQKYM
jgi:hypothetical protein